MASRTITVYTDDLDGAEIKSGKGGPVSFSIEGIGYTIDLSDKNKAHLVKALQPYVDAGTRVRKTGGTKKNAGGINAKEVRLWAQSNDYDVPARGRVPQPIWDAYFADN